MQLRLEGVSKHWGQALAVDRASFATDSGKLVVLLGPSGCGKSTLLGSIAGLDTPSAGRILLDERDVPGLAPAERRISRVFQSYALFPHLSVAENILFGASRWGARSSAPLLVGFLLFQRQFVQSFMRAGIR